MTLTCLFQLLFFIEFGTYVTAQRVVFLGCNPFLNEQVVTLTATLDTTDSATLCFINPLTKAVFTFTASGSSAPSVICEQDVSAACNTTVTADGCACVSKTGNTWTLSQKFTYNKTKHEGGTFDLLPNCAPAGDFGNRQKCTNMQTVTTTSTTTTSTSTTTSAASSGSSSAPSSSPVIFIKGQPHQSDVTDIANRAGVGGGELLLLIAVIVCYCVLQN